MSSQHRCGLRLIAFGTLLAMGLSGPAISDEQAPQPEQQAPSAQSGDNNAQATNVPEARLRVRELLRQLESIRNQALENDSALQAQQQALQQKVNERMEARGVDPQADLERLREIATQLRSSDLTEAEQQELANEYRRKRRELLEARDAVLNDKEIRQGRERFSQALLTAMKKVEPDVERIIRRYNEAQAELRRKLGAAERGLMGN